jgi:hypothetical protein
MRSLAYLNAALNPARDEREIEPFGQCLNQTHIRATLNYKAQA